MGKQKVTTSLLGRKVALKVPYLELTGDQAKRLTEINDRTLGVTPEGGVSEREAAWPTVEAEIVNVFTVPDSPFPWYTLVISESGKLKNVGETQFRVLGQNERGNKG